MLPIRGQPERRYQTGGLYPAEIRGAIIEGQGYARSVSYYADTLCYTPKHFSKVIKQACGRTPLDLINETTIEHIKYRLKRSDKSVKEIAEEFNFPNQSFFGKYVKSIWGLHRLIIGIARMSETKNLLESLQVAFADCLHIDLSRIIRSDSFPISLQRSGDSNISLILSARLSASPSLKK